MVNVKYLKIIIIIERNKKVENDYFWSDRLKLSYQLIIKLPTRNGKTVLNKKVFIPTFSRSSVYALCLL